MLTKRHRMRLISYSSNFDDFSLKFRISALKKKLLSIVIFDQLLANFFQSVLFYFQSYKIQINSCFLASPNIIQFITCNNTIYINSRFPVKLTASLEYVTDLNSQGILEDELIYCFVGGFKRISYLFIAVQNGVVIGLVSHKTDSCI